MHPKLSLKRWMLVAAVAGGLSLGVPLASPIVPAQAAAVDSRQSPRDTTTVTTTCGNGLIVLGPIVVPISPHSTTVIDCGLPRSGGGTSWLP
jgi:hypothetical protein